MGSRAGSSKRASVHIDDSDEDDIAGLFSEEEDPNVNQRKDGEEKLEKRWIFSTMPEEDFSQYEGRDWTCQIVGEEVDSRGKVFYEIHWDDWTRNDGTSTTWVPSDTEDVDLTSWKRAQKNARIDLADDSLEVGLDFPTVDIHNTETFLRSEAYEEKLEAYEKRQKKRQENIFADMARELAKHQEHPNLPRSAFVQGNQSSSSSSSVRTRASQRASVRQQTVSSMQGSSSTHTRSSAQAPASVPSSSRLSTFSSSSAISQVEIVSTSSSLPVASSKKKRRVASDSEESIASAPQAPSPHRPAKAARTVMDPESQRNTLGEQWTAVAKEAGAASIRFVNDVDDEPIPSIDPSFVYLERRYNFSEGIQKPSTDFLISCECTYSCSKAYRCDCQTQVLDEVDTTIQPAYLPSGLYSFAWPEHLEVVECNTLCSCSARKCTNRVSQKPRRIPIEIFKTTKHGWGVRSPKDIKKGQVLGLYTGLVMTRADAENLEDHAYHFPLDHSDGSSPANELYSVDARTQGNWTRFINHSCAPNVIVYTVVHDTPPNSGLPFIAFVAVEDIPARREFTFDYSPKDSMAYHTSGGKAKKKKPKGATTCHCGTLVCRGYIAS
ncbi:hypothetical protein D9613_004892 [Agrocybe pediades]|uniref:SET domain-containing protein n=1 Tax=Agrocybe pediades TaxID=84607 RepID=A0A8H4VTB0_9AGAR|nr:hypothetical protein D9613_004892 [Agrocybe pediades]